jgi:hypothetical protein
VCVGVVEDEGSNCSCEKKKEAKPATNTAQWTGGPFCGRPNYCCQQPQQQVHVLTVVAQGPGVKPGATGATESTVGPQGLRRQLGAQVNLREDAASTPHAHTGHVKRHAICLNSVLCVRVCVPTSASSRACVVRLHACTCLRVYLSLSVVYSCGCAHA